MTREHNLEYYLAGMKVNLSRSSRTVEQGRVDRSVSGSKDKPKSEISDTVILKTLAEKNVLSSLREIYGRKDEKFGSV